jgi:hypothetical protein
MNRDGNVTETAAREMVTAPSSSGLAHHFQNISLKFGEFIQEEDAIVPQRNFPRPRAHHQPPAVLKHSGHAVNARRLDGFLERHRRQDRRDALRQHGLPRAPAAR